METQNSAKRMRYCAPAIECIAVHTEQGIAISGQAGDYAEGGELSPNSNSSYVQF